MKHLIMQVKRIDLHVFRKQKSENNDLQKKIFLNV